MSGVRCTRRLQGSVKGRLPNLEARCGLSDIQAIGDVFLGSLQFLSGDDRFAATLAPACGGSS